MTPHLMTYDFLGGTRPDFGIAAMTEKSPASKGSQRWLQLAVSQAPELLDEALRRAGAITKNDSVTWKSPLRDEGYKEYRDASALRKLGIATLPGRPLQDFWPPRGPVWDALGISDKGLKILIEAKAHIAEAASPPSKATPESLELIRRSLAEARTWYAPKAKAEWSENLYQYANRLAFQYLLHKQNAISSRVVFIDFVNASDVGGPESEAAWKGATQLMHALLGLPADIERFGVFHAYVDVRKIAAAG